MGQSAGTPPYFLSHSPVPAEATSDQVQAVGAALLRRAWQPVFCGPLLRSVSPRWGRWALPPFTAASMTGKGGTGSPPLCV